MGDLRAVFSRERQFRGADIALARKFTRIGWLLGVAVAYALFPFYPPTEAIGSARWLLGPGAASGATLRWLYFLFPHDERVSFNVPPPPSFNGVVLLALRP